MFWSSEKKLKKNNSFDLLIWSSEIQLSNPQPLKMDSFTKSFIPIFDNVSLDIMANLIKMIFFLLNNYKILRKKIKKWQKCMNYENWDFLFAFIQLTFLLVTISCQCQYSPSYLHTPLFKIYLEFETFM
jgi:hypothetical protein